MWFTRYMSSFLFFGYFTFTNITFNWRKTHGASIRTNLLIAQNVVRFPLNSNQIYFQTPL